MAGGKHPVGRAATRERGPGAGDRGDVRRVADEADPAPVADRTPEQLGEPPEWLDGIALPLVEPPESLFYQSHTLRRGPLNFNPSRKGRFNAPNGEYGTTYLSTSPEGAFVETFVQDAPRTSSGRVSVTQTRLDASCLCHVTYRPGARRLRLVDLTGPGVIAIGATGELCALADISRLALVQRWALRLYRHPTAPDGISYRARHDPSRISIALLSRAANLLTADCSRNVLNDASRLAAILDLYGVGLV